MAKLLLLSTVFSVFVIPTLSGRDPHARRGLRKMLLLMLAFNIFYWFAIRYLYRHFA